MKPMRLLRPSSDSTTNNFSALLFIAPAYLGWSKTLIGFAAVNDSDGERHRSHAGRGRRAYSEVARAERSTPVFDQ